MAETKTKKAQRLIKKQIAASESEIDAIVSRVSAIVNGQISEIVRAIESGGIEADNALQLFGTLQGLESAIEQAGFNEQVERIREAFNTELENVVDRLELETGISRDKIIYSDFNIESLEAIASAQIEQSMQVLNKYIIDARAQIAAQVITGERVRLDQIIDDVDRRTYANLNTELNTAVSAFHMTAHAIQTDDLGFTEFIYAGPDDSVTRPFCRHVLAGGPSREFNIPASKDGVYTIEQVRSMDNDQGLAVRQYGGGYNCRHRWLVSEVLNSD